MFSLVCGHIQHQGGLGKVPTKYSPLPFWGREGWGMELVNIYIFRTIFFLLSYQTNFLFFLPDAIW